MQSEQRIDNGRYYTMMLHMCSYDLESGEHLGVATIMNDRARA